MMMPYDAGDFSVVLDVRENSLSDYDVLLHFTAFLGTEWTGFLEEAIWEANLSYIVDESGKMRQTLLLLAQPETPRDIARVHGHRGRVARRVLITCVESGNKSRREL
jgi:hypothetical protein